MMYRLGAQIFIVCLLVNMIVILGEMGALLCVILAACALYNGVVNTFKNARCRFPDASIRIPYLERSAAG